ncbi:hypothetical protein ES703_109860 [subsurface metagenome]
MTVGVRVAKANIYGAHLDIITGDWSSYHNACRLKMAVGAAPPAVFRFSKVTINEHTILLTDHDADSGLLLEKTTADYLDITPAFEWTGPRKSAINCLW